MTTASKLTLARVFLIPVYMLFMYMSECEANIWMWLALGVFILASVTDFGKFMDPLADKLLTIAAMCVFCEWGVFPAWALMIVLTREFAVSGLRMVAGPKGSVIAAGKSGKFKTASTMVGLCVMMAFPTNVIVAWVVIAAIVLTTVYSGVEYFIQNWKVLWD